MPEHGNEPASMRLKRSLGKDLRLEIVEQDGQRRVSRWKDAGGVVRAESTVTFDESGTNAFPDLHSRILAGAPIGETFVSAGIPFHRDVKKETESVDGRRVFVDVSVGPQKTLYAHIEEYYPAELPPQFEIESAKPSDAEAIARIQHDSWLATYVNDAMGISREVLETRLADLEKRVEYWRELIKRGFDWMHIDVVREGGEVIGFCKVSKMEIENHVDALYLDPTRMKQGAGGAVFRAGLEWLGDEKPITLEVVSYNADAIGFYEHFGFESVGPGKGIDLRNGQSMPNLVMRRPARVKL